MIRSVPVRVGTTAEWADTDASDRSAAPVLRDGEVGIDSDTGAIKVGDGETAFPALTEIGGGGGGGAALEWTTPKDAMSVTITWPRTGDPSLSIQGPGEAAAWVEQTTDLQVFEILRSGLFAVASVGGFASGTSDGVKSFSRRIHIGPIGGGRIGSPTFAIPEGAFNVTPTMVWFGFNGSPLSIEAGDLINPGAVSEPAGITDFDWTIEMVLRPLALEAA